MDLAMLGKYLKAFAELKRNKTSGHGLAPHKPILLLCILDEIKEGRIQDNFIVLTPELVATFQAYWKALVTDDYWQPKIEYPFRHLYQDGFWDFVQYGHIVAPEPMTYSLKQLRESFDGVQLAADLWQLLQEREALDALHRHLLTVYFHSDSVQRESTEDFLNAAAQKLMVEAHSKFRVKKVKEGTDNGYFIRHSLFPRVVKQLYNHTCAVCGVSAHLGNLATLVDAAHILEFSIFHYDDPRNGISLCKNHHWGFDAGAFAITEEYKILVSPVLAVSGLYLTNAALVVLPENPLYHPAPAALLWHRLNRYKAQ